MDDAFFGGEAFYVVACHGVAVDVEDGVGGDGLADAVGVGDAVVVEVGDEIVGESSAGEGEEGECEFHIEWGTWGFFLFS